MPTAFAEYVLAAEEAIPVQSSGVDSRVDDATGVIRGVKVVGLKSRNPARVLGLDPRQFGSAALQKPYTYDRAALEAALPLYDNARVFVGHPQFGYTPNGSRTIAPGAMESRTDLFGWIANPRMGPDGVYADLHYLTAHPRAKQVAEAARRNPRILALSHLAATRPELRGDSVVITEINGVESVDLVFTPAGTTVGLFESAESPMSVATVPAELTVEALESMTVEEIADVLAAEMGCGGTGKQMATASEMTDDPLAQPGAAPDPTMAAPPMQPDQMQMEAAPPVPPPAPTTAAPAQPPQPTPGAGAAAHIDDGFRKAVIAVVNAGGLDDAGLIDRLGTLIKAKQAAQGALSPQQVAALTDDDPTNDDEAMGDEADEDEAEEQDEHATGDEPMDEPPAKKPPFPPKPKAKPPAMESAEDVLAVLAVFEKHGVAPVQVQVRAALALESEARDGFVQSLRPQQQAKPAPVAYVPRSGAKRPALAAEAAAERKPQATVEAYVPGAMASAVRR